MASCIAPSSSLYMDSTEIEYQQTLELDSTRESGLTLKSLKNQLQFYKTPSCTSEGEMHNEIIRSVDGSINSLSRANSRGKRAAVLVCIFEGHEGELRVILTKRSMNLSSHPGEVALPGGKMDDGDADESAAALREAMEEIGLDPSLVQVVTNLEPFISKHLLMAVPVVGLLQSVEDFRPLLNADEVDAIFNAPLEKFLKDDCHRYEERECGGQKYVCHLFDYETDQGDFLVAGLTASILI